MWTVQNLVDGAALLILILASIGCLKVMKWIYREAPICYRLYQGWVLFIDAIVLIFAFRYKCPLK